MKGCIFYQRNCPGMSAVCKCYQPDKTCPMRLYFIGHAYWTRKMDGVILCSNCFGQLPSTAITNSDGQYKYQYMQETKYCPYCGCIMDGQGCI